MSETFIEHLFCVRHQGGEEKSIVVLALTELPGWQRGEHAMPLLHLSAAAVRSLKAGP